MTDTIPSSNLVDLLKRLVHLNGQLITLEETVMQEASASHTDEPDEQTRLKLRHLIGTIHSSSINTLSYQSNLTGILSRLLVQGGTTNKQEEST